MKKHPEFDFKPPSKAFIRNFIAPFKRYFEPEFIGIDEIDATRPAMYVSNHAVTGLLDGYPFGAELYVRKGIYLRALADRAHFKVPVWGDLLSKNFGAIEGSRANCAALMERGENLLVFPGGSREVFKKKGEAYVLKWEDRRGFVRMAMEYGYDIIPVAAVGAEDAYTVVKDAKEILDHSFGGWLLKQTGLASTLFKDGEMMLPWVKGVGKTVFPKPVKLYFSFGKRIPTKRYKAMFEDTDTQELIKSKVELSLLRQFQHLFEVRETEKDEPNTLRRIINVVSDRTK